MGCKMTRAIEKFQMMEKVQKRSLYHCVMFQLQTLKLKDKDEQHCGKTKLKKITLVGEWTTTHFGFTQ